MIQENKRILWLDTLKGFTIIFVIIGHVLLGYTNNNTFPLQQQLMLKINYWIYSWHMPLFMAISGFAFKVAYLKENKLDKKRINKQILNLILIFFIFQLGLCSFKIIFNSFVDSKMDFSKLILNLFIPDNIMWYVWVLVIYYFFLEIIYSKVRISSEYIYIYIIFIGVTTKIISEYFGIILGVKNLFYCFQFFIFGIWLADKYLLKGKSEIKNKITLVSVIYIIFYIFFLSIKNVENFLPFIKIILEVINAYAVTVIVFKVFSKIKEIKFLMLCGKESLVVYLLHTYFVTAIKAFIIRSNFSSVGIIIILTTIIPLFICLVVAKLSHKIKLLEYVFKPIKFVQKLKEFRSEKI